MKKLISAVTSLCVAATMVSAVAPISSGAAETKGFAIKTLDGASTTIDCSSGDVKLPLAIYLTESEADTSSVAVAASFVSGPEVGKVKIAETDVYDFASDFYSEAKTFEKADGTTFDTTYVPAWCGSFSRKGAYTGAGGSYNALTAKDKMAAYGCDYAYVAGGWTNVSGTYTYTGATSDAYPFLVFTVTFPQGIAAGDYTIDFVNVGADSEHPENKATMIEVGNTKFTKDNGNLTVDSLTITVAGDAPTSSSTQTTATTTKPDNTTTTTSVDTSDADIVVDLGNYTVPSGGGDVEMNVTMDPKGNYLTSVSAFMTAPDGIVWDGMEDKSPAFGSAITINDNQMKFNFATLNGSAAKTCDAGAEIATIYWIVPETTADGTYQIGCDKFEIMNGTDVYKVAVINGTITVGEGGETSSTTTSATTTSSTTTTTTTTSTTTTSSTTTTEKQPGTPDYGDANCDGVVNVADVVVLNKWRNDNTSYDLTAQGKLNADCFAPKGGDEITDEDSLAILQSIVHLVTLPATALAE
ncbi:MAG: hypothetical protein IJM44_03210 [Ruminococcus sp.]|nr:hypothetical protein [Ruminococcus sp.]